MARRSTSTSAFGVSRRENHDSSGFYRRFAPPVMSAEPEVAIHRALNKLIVGDARRMDEVSDSSVAQVVTSPPYFAGKEYEESLGEDGIPATYREYLDLLRDVFAQCVRKLEPGGRIPVNVANLGRRPYHFAVSRRHRDLAGRSAPAAARRDHLVEAARLVGVVCLGKLRAARKPGTLRGPRAACAANG
jgi:hypothetical protein